MSIDFGQIFQNLWQYTCNLTIFWHGLLPNMVMARDSVILCIKYYFLLNFKFCCSAAFLTEVINQNLPPPPKKKRKKNGIELKPSPELQWTKTKRKYARGRTYQITDGYVPLAFWQTNPLMEYEQMAFPLWSLILKYTPNELQGSQYDGNFSEKLISRFLITGFWKLLQTLEMIWEITEIFIQFWSMLDSPL